MGFRMWTLWCNILYLMFLNRFGLVLCSLMTPGLSNDIRCHVWPYFSKSQITRSDIRPHLKWAVSLVTAYGHFNFSQGFVWVYEITYSLYHPSWGGGGGQASSPPGGALLNINKWFYGIYGNLRLHPFIYGVLN